MSVQLIVYPQNHDGQFNILSNQATQFINDGISFFTLNDSDFYSSGVGNPTFLALQNQPPLQINAWYRFRSTSTGTPSFPTQTSNDVVFSATTTSSLAGIYQRVSNLAIGQNYDITINLSSAAPGYFFLQAYSGTVLAHTSFNFANATSITSTFQASQSDHTIVISYFNTAATTATVTGASVLPQGTTPNFTDFELSDGQAIVDLYENEDIPLTLSIDNFIKADEKTQSYSKAFNLPATKRNNRIFNNMFEITRADDGVIFNPYVKTKATLKQDGYLLFEGYLRMIDVNDKEGEISYNVNLYSESVALADFLKGKTFADFDFSELEHPYNYTQIKNSWNFGGTGITYSNPSTSGFRNDNSTIKYPFVDWAHQYTTNSSNMPELDNLQNTFRPWINAKYLLDRIFDESPFTYTSTIFDSNTFANLYMDFNWGADTDPNEVTNTGGGSFHTGNGQQFAPTSYTTFEYPQENFSNVDNFGYSSGVFTCPAGNTNATYNFTSTLQLQAVKDAIVYFRWRYTPNGGTAQTVGGQWAASLKGAPIYQLQVGSTILGPIQSIIGGTMHDDSYVFSSGVAPTNTIIASSVSAAGGDVDVNISGANKMTGITINNGGGGYFGDTYLEYTLSDGTVQTPTNANFYRNITQQMEPGDTLHLEWYSNVANAVMVKKYINENPSWDTSTDITVGQLVGSVTLAAATTNTLLQTLRGETSQFEFLKGIMTMFNLIAIPDKTNPTNINFETYKEVFISDTAGTTLASRGIQHNWTDLVDITDIKLRPLTNLNKKTIFKYVTDDDDASALIFKNATNHEYGSKVFDASGFTLLEGEKTIEAKPFAATVIKPLMFEYPDLITPSIYALDDDDNTSSFDNAPRLLFNNGIKNLSTTSFDVPSANGVSAATGETAFLQFSHLTTIPANSFTADYNFGEHQLVQIGASTPTNLFNTFWLPYYSQLYNPNTRIMTLKVNLSASDINNFDFNDQIMIKNKVFRVNKIDYKPTDLSTVEFILIPNA